ncbi:MAG: hypothetical protein HYW86_00270 [Candidatus Roizmanbacteria bacterium]|nr:MAG: hypothetical protein HYW86_00270 [Candidatus Roizmanbacteria bacterium]
MHKIPYIKKGHQGGMDFQEEQKLGSSFFLYLYFGGVIIFFIVLLLRLFHLTVVKGEYYKRAAEGNRIREVIIEPKRGMLVDRRGVVLSQNYAADLHGEGDRLKSIRIYQDPEIIAPFVGYRQTADEKDIKSDPCLNKLTLGDKVGKKSIEKIYDCELRGKNGKKLVEVDAGGKILKTLNVIAPEDGKTIKLSLDSLLQKKAYEIINNDKFEVKDKKVAVVGLKPQTGEVLVLAAWPSFNPQDFEDGNNESVKAYINNKDKPLFNRATEGTYPPGSIFKLVLAAAALEEKKIDEATMIEDTGKIKAGPIEFGNWYYLERGKTEGLLNVVKALARSNDIYFYKVGEKVGSDLIKSWAEKFGLGKKTGIEFEESEGLIPSAFWKEDVLKEQWYLGDTYNLSIGQGYILVTPLQMALAVEAIANKGTLCKPQILKNTDEKTNCHRLPLSKKTLDIIKQGMIQACTPGGTGWPLFNYKAPNSKGEMVETPVACKTGTAESHALSKEPHAWFTVFAPAENPEIVLTVLVEEGGQGSDIAAPIAKEILNAYFERKE